MISQSNLSLLQSTSIEIFHYAHKWVTESRHDQPMRRSMNTEEQAKTILAAESAVKDNPNNSEAYVELGMTYFHAERFKDAMDAFQQAIVMNPDAARAYNGIGRVCYHAGPAQAAIEAYERAIDLDRNYIDPYYGLGILYSAQLGNYDAAIRVFQRGLEHNPTEAFLVASLGSTYARVGAFEEAIDCLQQAIVLQPKNDFAYSWLSIIYLHLKRYDEVIIACQHEIEITDNHAARRLLGYMYGWLGRYEEAIDQLEQSIALEPEDYEAGAALARIYRIVGSEQKAEEHYTLAAEMAGRDDEYGQACFEAVSGNLDKAIALLEVALKMHQVQPGWVRIDPEFAFFQDDPRFKGLIDSSAPSYTRA
jgi:superkiller protein 3